MNRDPGIQIGRIDTMMEQRGWGPGELAERSGVAYDTIYKIRSSQRPRTSAEIVAKLAVALGCSVDYLLGLSDDPTPASGEAMSALLVNLCGIVRALSVTRQRDLLRIAEALQAAGRDEPTDHLQDEMMEMVLEEIQRIGGEESLNAVLDRLESAFPDSWAAFDDRGRGGQRFLDDRREE